MKLLTFFNNNTLLPIQETVVVHSISLVPSTPNDYNQSLQSSKGYQLALVWSAVAN